MIRTPSELKIKKGTVIPPDNGWKEKTYYLTEVACSKFNVIHNKIFYSGFLHLGVPGGYSGFGCFNRDDEMRTLGDIYYAKVLEVLYQE